MKRLFHIAVVAALVALVTGCGGARRYDARLVAADSLMWTAPDSALATLTAIDSLTGEGNLAYRDLLMTQARYKCYADITASDDSAITRAIDYYRAHSSQREKLTRAYLYKGAVMEELDRIDSAMYYYKTAEATADPKDYRNLGYSKMRIAELYENQHSQNDSAIIRLKDAVNCFDLTDDTTFLISCYGLLGSISGMKYPDLTEKYLNKAIELAQHFDPPRQYTYKSNLAGFIFYYHKDYQRANRLAMDVFKNGREDCLEYQFYYYAIITFLKMNKVDSAKYVLSRTPPPIDAVDSMNLFDAKAEVAKAESNAIDYGKNAVKSRELTSQILASSKEKQLVKTEVEYNKQQILKKGLKAQRRTNTLAVALVMAVTIMLLLLGFYHYRKTRFYHQIISDLKNDAGNQLNDLARLKANIEKLKIQDNQLKDFISSHLNLTSELVEACYHNPQSKLTEQVKRIVQFQHDNEQKWTQLYHYIDAEYNNLISKTRDNYPQLNDKDLMLIALTSIGFSYIQIAIIMGYSNATSVSTIKQRLAQKMHLDGSLNDYINSIINS